MHRERGALIMHFTVCGVITNMYVLHPCMTPGTLVHIYTGEYAVLPPCTPTDWPLVWQPYFCGITDCRCRRTATSRVALPPPPLITQMRKNTNTMATTYFRGRPAVAHYSWRRCTWLSTMQTAHLKVGPMLECDGYPARVWSNECSLQKRCRPAAFPEYPA